MYMIKIHYYFTYDQDPHKSAIACRLLALKYQRDAHRRASRWQFRVDNPVFYHSQKLS
jgi:hypothetical protein